jgi:hypothetical protein
VKLGKSAGNKSKYLWSMKSLLPQNLLVLSASRECQLPRCSGTIRSRKERLSKLCLYKVTHTFRS